MTPKALLPFLLLIASCASSNWTTEDRVRATEDLMDTASAVVAVLSAEGTLTQEESAKIQRYTNLVASLATALNSEDGYDARAIIQALRGAEPEVRAMLSTRLPPERVEAYIGLANVLFNRIERRLP